MTNKCKQCGDEISSEKQICEDCQKVVTNLCYAYSELRFEMWNYIKNHGSKKALALYNDMAREMGEPWAQDAVGDKLFAELERMTNG